MAEGESTGLRAALTASHAFAAEIDAEDFPRRAFTHLQDWQRARLARSYADLAGQPHNAAAAQFFLTELYGGQDVRERDRAVERVLPVMERMLPRPMRATLAEAFELQALSLDFDIDMARRLDAGGDRPLDVARYAELYRACGRQEDRRRQIEMIRRLGQDLQRVVHKPMVLWLVRMMRGPAHSAGFGALQDFLERGLEAFRALDGDPEFVETIYRRERRAMQALFAGDAAPFGDIGEVDPEAA